MSFGSDVRSCLHDLDLFRRLEHAHLVHNRCRVNDRLRRVYGLAIDCTHACDLSDDGVVELAIHTEPVIKHVGTFEKFLQLRPKLRSRKRFCCSKLALRAFNSSATPVPDLSFRISRPHKQRVFLV